MTVTLYEAPGQVAVRRGRIGNIVVVAALVAAIVWGVYRLAVTGQFEARRWEQFRFASIQAQLVDGLLNTLQAAAIASVLALALGVVLAVARISDRRWLSRTVGGVVDLLRAVPMLILMFFFYYGSLQYDLGISPMWAVIFGLMLYNGAVLAEVFRAGIQSVPPGQREAAYSLGMRKSQVLRLVLLPQGVRAMLPAIVSQLVILVKDTALGSIITFNELIYVGRQMGGRPEFGFPFVPTYLVIAAIYIGICGVLTWVAYALERGSGRSRRSLSVVPSSPAVARAS